MYTYMTKGTCSLAIKIDTDGETVRSVEYIEGCNGNTQGIAKLVAGRPVDEVISLLKGIKCGYKGTSCPDQLATALEMIKSGELKEEVEA